MHISKAQESGSDPDCRTTILLVNIYEALESPACLHATLLCTDYSLQKNLKPYSSSSKVGAR